MGYQFHVNTSHYKWGQPGKCNATDSNVNVGLIFNTVSKLNFYWNGLHLQNSHLNKLPVTLREFIYMKFMKGVGPRVLWADQFVSGNGERGKKTPSARQQTFIWGTVMQKVWRIQLASSQSEGNKVTSSCQDTTDHNGKRIRWRWVFQLLIRWNINWLRCMHIFLCTSLSTLGKLNMPGQRERSHRDWMAEQGRAGSVTHTNGGQVIIHGTKLRRFPGGEWIEQPFWSIHSPFTCLRISMLLFCWLIIWSEFTLLCRSCH